MLYAKIECNILSLCIMCRGCHVLSVESTCTRGRGRGIAGGLVRTLLQPLWPHLGKMLAQIKEVQSREVLVDGVKGQTWSELPGTTACIQVSESPIK